MRRIRLLGIKGDKNYEIWKHTARKVLKKMSLESELEEVNSVDEIVLAGSIAIPAIMIDSVPIIYQNGHVINENELRSAIENFLIKEQ